MIPSNKTGNPTNKGNTETIYIDGYDKMPPFFMSLVSRDNLWTYVSSHGSLSAGRGSEDQVIFPYVTVDKIHDSYGITGPRTLIRLEDDTLWEPFSPNAESHLYSKRILSKTELSNRIEFSEQINDGSLSFTYSWEPAGRYGLARRVRIKNNGSDLRKLRVIDGVANIMPPKIDSRLQATRSTLADAYKQSEILPDSRMAVYSTASGITDRPFPMENLYCNCAWSYGLPEAKVTLAVDAPESMKRNATPSTCSLNRGQRGAYWLDAEIKIAAGQTRDWLLLMDCQLDAAELVGRSKELDGDPKVAKASIDAAIAKNDEELRELLAGADAFQESKDRMNQLHHTANVLFNSMRGGVFLKNYVIDGEDLQEHIKAANPKLYSAHEESLSKFKDSMAYDVCRTQIEALGDTDVLRLFLEYLPITFSRRHGDPSRPWNKFMICTHDAAGDPVLAYQGNWRDIFQNWEALCISYPNFLEHVVVKFLNTSTMDGYNPYRVFNGSFDWEEVDPEDPFSGIGYWGDHQIIYLLRLLEALQAHDPKVLDKWLNDALFVSANVPYRIKPLEAIFKNPRSTIVFDTELSNSLRLKEQSEGYDGLLLKDASHRAYKAGLIEKLLIPALVKLSNFVPGGGIWMNTERPEWNDANNALVGNGLSMVTAGYLLRYVRFCLNWWSRISDTQTLDMSSAVADFVKALTNIFDQPSRRIISVTTDSKERAKVLQSLGLAGQYYRERIYTGDFSTKCPVKMNQLLLLLEKTEKWLRTTLETAKRKDGLMDSYNLLSYKNPKDEIKVTRLYEMLEGQVSALSADYLNSQEVINLVDQMFNSALYTAGQKSFLLYPDRRLPEFLEKGILDKKELSRSKLLKDMLCSKDISLIKADKNGIVRFAPTIENSEALDRALESLSKKPDLGELIQSEKSLIHSIYEKAFSHETFTGRSGGMFSYEGLGCIYWHQVSKLLLAVQECFFRESESANSDPKLVQELGDRYYKIRAGIGSNKTAQEFGAFPTDPYSHTPSYAGAQQPGMTGQAKEEIITRFGELGLRIRSGTIHLNPRLLRLMEFSEDSRIFEVLHTDGSRESINLNAGELAFTYCQVPFIYKLCKSANAIEIRFNSSEGSTEETICDVFPRDLYKSITQRDGTIRRVEVTVPSSLLLA